MEGRIRRQRTRLESARSSLAANEISRTPQNMHAPDRDGRFRTADGVHLSSSWQACSHARKSAGTGSWPHCNRKRPISVSSGIGPGSFGISVQFKRPQEVRYPAGICPRRIAGDSKEGKGTRRPGQVGQVATDSRAVLECVANRRLKMGPHSGSTSCGRSSIGRASAFQAECCRFDPGRPLFCQMVPCAAFRRLRLPSLDPSKP